MDTTAYLRSQGWLGTGHSLNPGTKRGLSKPIKVRQKQNVLGVGKREHETLTGQWWAKAFDDVLQGVNGSDIKTEKGKKENTNTCAVEAVNFVGNARIGTLYGYGNLYSGFVKGEGLQGTLKLDLSEPVGGDLAEEVFGGGDPQNEQKKEGRQRKQKRPNKGGEYTGNGLPAVDVVARTTPTSRQMELTSARPPGQDDRKCKKQRRQKRREKRARTALTKAKVTI